METVRALCQLFGFLIALSGGVIAIVALYKTWPSIYHDKPFPKRAVAFGFVLIFVGGLLGYMTASDGAWLQE